MDEDDVVDGMFEGLDLAAHAGSRDGKTRWRRAVVFGFVVGLLFVLGLYIAAPG